MSEQVFNSNCEICGDPIGARVAVYNGDGKFSHYECERQKHYDDEEKLRQLYRSRRRRQQ